MYFEPLLKKNIYQNFLKPNELYVLYIKDMSINIWIINNS